MAFDFNRYQGRVLLPPTTGTLLSGLDPAHSKLLELIADALAGALVEAWASSTLARFSGTTPVESRFPVEASAELVTSTKVKFPALFVWREGQATYDEFSFSRVRKTQQWGVEWILGPFTPDESVGFIQALAFFGDLVGQICQLGGHPDHALDFGETFPYPTLFETTNGCGFTDAVVKNVQMGGASFNEDGSPPIYHGCRVTLETTEVSGQQSDAANSTPHEGADFKFTGDDEGDDQADEDEWADFEEFVQVKSDP